MSRRRILLVLLLPLIVLGLCYWQWGIKRWAGKSIDHHVIADGIELTIGEFRHPDSDGVTVFAVQAHPLQEDCLIVFDVPDTEDDAQSFLATAHRHHAFAMTNGGYFDTSFEPVGLVVNDGQTLSEISEQPALSGILAFYKDRSFKLIPRAAFLPDESIKYAIQAGPFLVDPGGKPGIRSDDLKKAKRTAIGQTATGNIVFISTTPCTLYELSKILTERQGALGVEAFDRVLNLDGGPSTGFYVQGQEKYHVIPETDVPSKILLRSR